MKKLSRFILLLVGFVVLTSGCTRGASPEGLSFKGTSIVVWDVKEPHLPGASPYSEVAAGIVADACARGAKGRHAGVGAEAGGVGGGLAGVDGRGHAGAVGVVEGDAGGGARGEDVGVGEGGDGGDG